MLFEISGFRSGPEGERWGGEAQRPSQPASPGRGALTGTHICDQILRRRLSMYSGHPLSTSRSTALSLASEKQVSPNEMPLNSKMTLFQEGRSQDLG